LNRKAVVKELQVGLSFFEIYADELYDLLNGRTKARQRPPPLLLQNRRTRPSHSLSQLHAREDAKKRVVVQVRSASARVTARR
jgi:hypothetical protein